MSVKLQPRDRVIDYFMTAHLAEASGTLEVVRRIVKNRDRVLDAVVSGKLGQRGPRKAAPAPKDEKEGGDA